MKRVKKKRIRGGRIISSKNYRGTNTRPLLATSSKRDKIRLGYMCKGATGACVSVFKSSQSRLVLTQLRLKSHILGQEYVIRPLACPDNL